MQISHWETEKEKHSLLRHKSEDLLESIVPEPPELGRNGAAKWNAEKGRGGEDAAGAYVNIQPGGWTE